MSFLLNKYKVNITVKNPAFLRIWYISGASRQIFECQSILENTYTPLTIQGILRYPSKLVMLFKKRLRKFLLNTRVIYSYFNNNPK